MKQTLLAPLPITYIMEYAAERQSKVAIVIVTYNAPDFVRLCLESVRRYTTMDHEVIVVDNASGAETRDYLRGLDFIRLIESRENLLWCRGCNVGIGAVSPEATHVLLLNSDMEVRRADWLQRMVNVIDSSPRIGLIGTAPDRVRIWPTFGGVDGQCLMIKKPLIDKIGLLDSETYPWNGGDIDYAARAFKAGYIYKIMPEHPELVVHYHGMSRRQKHSEAPASAKLERRLDLLDVIRRPGLRAWRMPQWLWSLYKRLPHCPFYELSHAERKIAQHGLR